jgi:hypothetical protein
MEVVEGGAVFVPPGLRDEERHPALGIRHPNVGNVKG